MSLEAIEARLVKDVEELNFKMWLLVREWARHDVASAARMYGIQRVAARRIADMTMDQLKRLSQSADSMFAVRDSKSLIALSNALAADDTSRRTDILQLAALISSVPREPVDD